MSYPRFEGNCPRNVARDAKYTVRSARGDGGTPGAVVALTYRSVEDERWYATTDEHTELVNMVNDVKRSQGNPPNGAFYINEYKQVIVPAVGTADYFLAGVYDKPLRFQFEEKVLSGEAVDLEGNPLSPGDRWVGPHPGIPYTLAASAKDVRFTMCPRPNVEKDVKLSKAIGAERAQAVAAKIAAVKGYGGGRFFVNEFLSIFAPMQESGEWIYTYVGKLDLGEWFPMPHADPVPAEVSADAGEPRE
jgi:hypothetical protein